jgi:hypothetical protein
VHNACSFEEALHSQFWIVVRDFKTHEENEQWRDTISDVGLDRVVLSSILKSKLGSNSFSNMKKEQNTPHEGEKTD